MPLSQPLLWPIVLAPLAGAVLNVCFGRPLQRRLGRGVVQAVAVAAVLVAAALRGGGGGPAAGAAGGRSARCVDRLWTLLAVGPLQVDLALALDPLSAVMILVITLVGALIHVYAIGYMQADQDAWRFFAYLNLFVFAMLLLVLADSLLLCFFGWEGVGLCSYLLIGYWYHHLPNAQAARKAFLVNRVGDCRVSGRPVLAVLVAGRGVHTGAAGAGAGARRPGWSRGQSTPRADVCRELRERLGCRDGRGCGGRAARRRAGCSDAVGARRGAGGDLDRAGAVPGHGGQVGPDPAVHLAARRHGRTNPGLGADPRRHHGDGRRVPGGPAVVPVGPVARGDGGAGGGGLLTALLGAVLAMVQQDLKKVLAYSTISQLGFMFLALGVGAHGAAVFHLVTHACFKACLFLAAGSVIHAMHGVVDDAVPSESGHDPRLASDPTDAQDMRNMGGLARGMPRTRLAYALGALALAGFPVAAGFYSKDEILWRAFDQRLLPVAGWGLWALALLTAGLTSYYVFRSYYLVFHARPPLGRGRAGTGAPRIAGHHAGAAAGAGGGVGGGGGGAGLARGLGRPSAAGGVPVARRCGNRMRPVRRRSARAPRCRCCCRRWG